jgi:serine protease inhibitor
MTVKWQTLPVMLYSRHQKRIGRLFLLLAAFLFQVRAQEAPQIQPAMFLRANDKFALDLLEKTHEETRERNVVVSPLPVSLIFAALWDGTQDTESSKEFGAAFHWDRDFATTTGGKMLLSRFEKPTPYPKPHGPTKNPDSPLLRYLQSGKPEELWLSAAFLYRGEGSLSQHFIDRVTHDFGFPFRAVGERTLQSEILAKNWDPSLPMPKITGHDDFWIISFTHLRTSWAGNTFADMKGDGHDFHLHSGEVVQAEFLKSEAKSYPYVLTDGFEAVQLSCLQASILFVLPAPDSNVWELEAAFNKNPDLVEPLLTWHQGDVQMPTFHFSYEVDLRSSLQKLGVRRIFTDSTTLVSMAPHRSGGILRGVAQKTEITVDGNGIRADSGTIVHGVYGGIGTVQGPFHMILERPFLFFIRDNVTHALLFVGVVMNPTLK